MAETKAKKESILDEIEDQIRTIGVLTSGGDLSLIHIYCLESVRD